MLRVLAVAALATLASGDSSPGTAPPGSCICSNAGNHVNIYGTCAKVETTDNGMKGKKKVIVLTHSGQIPPGLTGAETEDGYHERLAKTNFGRSGGTGA